MNTLYIYGPPASGKSTLAKRLSEEFGVAYVDLDTEIVSRIGMPISQYFAERGEGAFRDVESQALRDVAAPIVALGGGTLLRDENRAYAESRGFVAVLDVDDEEIARRIELAKGTRPLGNKAAERRAHYASFQHHVKPDTKIILPCHLAGDVAVPLSKSHAHRIMIADFLAGLGDGNGAKCDIEDFCEDIAATRRCLMALARRNDEMPPDGVTILDCGESGSTLRFIAPIAAALGVNAKFVRRGRLAQRPMLDYSELRSGRHELPGNISSQFVTGLLFALPLLQGDSEIAFSSPLESRGYVDMTLDVIRAYSIRIDETPNGFRVPGSQKYVRPEGGLVPEGDWSGAAFWFAANALGADVCVTNLSPASRQPDRAVGSLQFAVCGLEFHDGNSDSQPASPQLETRNSQPETRNSKLETRNLQPETRNSQPETRNSQPETRNSKPETRNSKLETRNSIDVSQFPDLYPALAVMAASREGETHFVNAARLRIKESDRIAAMESVLAAFGVEATSTHDAATVRGTSKPLRSCEIDSFNDHRIAMAAAIAATRADGPVLIHGASCVAKSYPGFFDDFAHLRATGRQLPNGKI